MERIDDLQAGGLHLIQDPDLFCFSTDAVLLADYARVHRGERVVDLGAGTGVLDLLMYARQRDATFTALELQQPLYDLLQRNVVLNGLTGPITPLLGDMQSFRPPSDRPYDVCVCNPPYEKAEHGAARTGRTQDIARKELAVTLAQVCAAADRCLRFGGRFYICFPAFRLAELIADLKSHRLEPKTMRLVHARPDCEARLALVMAAKGAHEGLRIAAPLFLRDLHGAETAELRQIYNRGGN